MTAPISTAQTLAALPGRGGAIAMTSGRRRFESLRNVLVVMAGTGLAQALTFACAPIISRLYAPADFGLFGTFAALAGILTAVATLRYSDAVMLPDSDEKAARVLLVACSAAAGVALALSVLAAMCAPLWLAQARQHGIVPWLWILPFFTLAVGLNQALSAWCARRKAFRQTATSQVVRSLTSNLGQVTAGWAAAGGSGLIAGSVAGEVLSGMALWRYVRTQDWALIRQSFCLRGLRAAALEFRDFVIYSTPQNLLNALSQGAPVLLLIHFYGAAVGGLYAFSVRVLETPMNFVLTGVRQVLYQDLSEAHNRRGDVVSLFVTSTTTLAGIAIGPAVVGFAVMPWLFGQVFGREWYVAGQYARWLILWFVPAFCNVPAMLLARILRKQRELLIFDVVLLGARVAVLGFGGYYLRAEQSVMAFSLLGCLFNSVLILYVWRVAVSERRAVSGGRSA